MRSGSLGGSRSAARIRKRSPERNSAMAATTGSSGDADLGTVPAVLTAWQAEPGRPGVRQCQAGGGTPCPGARQRIRLADQAAREEILE